MELSSRDKEIIVKLYPPFQKMCENFLLYCWDKGLNVHLTQGLRTWEEQNALLDKGVSRAIGGMSYHNYGLAFDIAFDNDAQKNGLQDPYVGNWELAANIGARCGLKPGYFWTSFQDKPHYQANIETGIAYLREAFLKGGMEVVWDLLDTIEKEAFIIPPSGFKID